MGPQTNWSESPSHLPFRDNLFPHANPSVANFLNLRRFSNSSFWFRAFARSHPFPADSHTQRTWNLKDPFYLRPSWHFWWFPIRGHCKNFPSGNESNKEVERADGQVNDHNQREYNYWSPITYWDALCLRLFILCLTQWYYPSFQEANLLVKEWHNFW